MTTNKNFESVFIVCASDLHNVGINLTLFFRELAVVFTKF